MVVELAVVCGIQPMVRDTTGNLGLKVLIPLFVRYSVQLAVARQGRGNGSADQIA